MAVLVKVFRYSFRRPYRYCSNALKVLLSLSGRYKIFSTDWLWIEACQNVILGKIDITMTAINKNFEIDKNRFFFGDLDRLLKIQQQKRKVWYSANNLREK